MELDPKVLSDLIDINMTKIRPQFEEGEQSPTIAYTALANAIVQFLPPEVIGSFSQESINELGQALQQEYNTLSSRVDTLASNANTPSEVTNLQEELYNTRVLVNELNARLSLVEDKEDIKVYIQATEEGVGR